MTNFLKETEVVNFSNTEIQKLAVNMSKGATSDIEVAKNCFIYVRDEINHSGDYKDDTITYRASDVLEHGTGWCYAKSILLVALLRANGIPAGFCYQRLSCSEYVKDNYCLHGLNSIFLQDYGWYRVDARGNKQGVDAQFSPPMEKLAFELQENELDLPEILEDPLDVVVNALKRHTTYDEIINNFPDINVLR